MRKKDIVVGSYYLAKVSGKQTTIKITGDSPYGGWVAVNVATRRQIRVRTAGRLKPEIW